MTAIMRTVLVRPRLDQDLAELVKVAARVQEVDGYPAYLPDNDFHRFLTRPTALAAWVAEADGRAVGHVALNAESHPGAMTVIRKAGVASEVGIVARLFVDPAVRCMGLGTRLLEQARGEAVRQGRLPVLDVVASAIIAIGMYRSRGWQELGRCEFAALGQMPIEEIIFAAPR